MYHVALDLSQEQVKELKVLAATNSTTVRALVSILVVAALHKFIKKEEQKQA